MTEDHFATRATRAIQPLLRPAAGAAAIFAGAALFGFLALAALFRTGVFGGIEILFYRGVVLCALAALATIAVVGWIGRRYGVAGVRDAVAAGVLTFGLNLNIVVLGPVTIDRSISVFINGYMAARAGETFTAGDIDRAFRDVYLTDMNQIDRRMQEQVASGNMITVAGGYRISEQGLAFVRSAKRLAELFGTDTRLLDASARTATVIGTRATSPPLAP